MVTVKLVPGLPVNRIIQRIPFDEFPVVRHKHLGNLPKLNKYNLYDKM